MTEVIVLSRDQFREIIAETAEKTARLILSEQKPSRGAKVPGSKGPARSQDGDEYLRANEVAALLKINIRSWQRLVAQDKAPQPFRVGRVTMWSRQKINEWIEQQS